MEISKFRDYKSVNEEFIGGLIKGTLSKLFSVFSEPFKDLSNDFKKLFKEDDPGSVKSIIMTNFNQAIDAAQKEIPKITDESGINDIMNKMVDSLVQLANGLDKDIIAGVGKDKAPPTTAIAKAVILGNKEAKWAGIVGLLDPTSKYALKYNGGIKTNYKYNKAEYDKLLSNIKSGGDNLKPKKDAANKFLDQMQKDISIQIDKEFTEDEIKKIYGEQIKNVSGDSEMTYDKLKDLYDKKVPVVYLLIGKSKNEYDPNKKPEEQSATVGVKKIYSVNDEDKNNSVTFLDKNGSPTIRKGYKDIIGPANTDGQNATKAKEILGSIKGDDDKMGKIVKFAEFLKDDKNKGKISEIEKIINTQK